MRFLMTEAQKHIGINSRIFLTAHLFSLLHCLRRQYGPVQNNQEGNCTISGCRMGDYGSGVKLNTSSVFVLSGISPQFSPKWYNPENSLITGKALCPMSKPALGKQASDSVAR